jgi:hypothetical protein
MPSLAFDFILGPDWSSRFIAWYGNGYGGYSHCAPVLADGRYLDARSDVLDGVPAGVHIRQPSSERWIKKRRASMIVPQSCYDEWEANLRARIGDGYGKVDIWGFITGHNDHQNGHWICSAHAINSVQHVKIVPYPLPVPAHQITPNSALLILASVGFVISPEIQQPAHLARALD